MFITFEGIEGSGKTTQAKALAKYLKLNGTNIVLTREPGGTSLAEKIRQLILDGQGINDPLTELMLLTAARRDHVENLIKPALFKGSIVICDRFIDSTIAYQGYGKGLDIDKIVKIHEIALGAFKPDLTFLIDVDPKIALSRIKAGRETNHYDNREIDFHTTIRNAFLDCAQNDPKRFCIIDGNNTHDETSSTIIKKFQSINV